MAQRCPHSGDVTRGCPQPGPLCQDLPRARIWLLSLSSARSGPRTWHIGEVTPRLTREVTPKARHPLLLSPSASAWPCVLPSPPCPFGVTSRGHSGGWGLSPDQGLWHQGDFGARSGSSPGPAQGLKEFWQQKHPEHPPGVSRLLTGCQGCHSVTRGVTVSPDSASRAQPGLGAPRLLRLLRR